MVIKHNFYKDTDYCNLLALCISHKCSYGVVTMANETFMAENMMKITNSIISEEHCIEDDDDD